MLGSIGVSTITDWPAAYAIGWSSRSVQGRDVESARLVPHHLGVPPRRVHRAVGLGGLEHGAGHQAVGLGPAAPQLRVHASPRK